MESFKGAFSKFSSLNMWYNPFITKVNLEYNLTFLLFVTLSSWIKYTHIIVIRFFHMLFHHCFVIMLFYSCTLSSHVFLFLFILMLFMCQFAKRKGTITTCSLYSIFQTSTIVLCWMNEDVTYGLHVVKCIPPLPKEKGK